MLPTPEPGPGVFSREVEGVAIRDGVAAPEAEVPTKELVREIDGVVVEREIARGGGGGATDQPNRAVRIAISDGSNCVELFSVATPFSVTVSLSGRGP